MKRRLLTVLLAGVLAAALTGCGGSDKGEDSGSDSGSGSGDSGSKSVKVAASATPHAEILEEAKGLLEAEGYELEVTVFNDYVQPNEVVESGDFDANYFQHITYQESFNE